MPLTTNHHENAWNVLFPQPQEVCGHHANYMLKAGVKWQCEPVSCSYAYFWVQEPVKFSLSFHFIKTNLSDSELHRPRRDWGILGFQQCKTITVWQTSNLSLQDSKIKFWFKVKSSNCLHFPGFYNISSPLSLLLLSSKLACKYTDYFPFWMCPSSKNFK